MRYAILIALPFMLCAAPVPKEKPPTLAELREVVRRLSVEVEALRAEVKQLRKQVARSTTKPTLLADDVKQALADGEPVVGMTEDQLIELLGPKWDNGGVLYERESLVGGKKAKRTVYSVQMPSWGFPKHVTVDDGIVVKVETP
jgi:hypothetical protein